MNWIFEIFLIVGSFELEPVCGRPKGMKVDKGGNLIVADAYLGLLKVSLPGGNVQVLIPNNKGMNDRFYIRDRQKSFVFFKDSYSCYS